MSRADAGGRSLHLNSGHGATPAQLGAFVAARDVVLIDLGGALKEGDECLGAMCAGMRANAERNGGTMSVRTLFVPNCSITCVGAAGVGVGAWASSLTAAAFLAC